MNPDELTRWLETVQCTSPFTLADARELRFMIKDATLDATSVEVVIGDAVHVRVAIGTRVIERDLHVV